jgi:DNA repair exonuclease SbcCD nuclease subunit
MKIAFLADVHARGKDLALFERQLRSALNAAEDNGAELVCIAGDVFDRSNIADRYASTGAIVQAVTGPLYASNLSHVIVRGDHDVAGVGSVDALAVLDQIENVTVVDEPLGFSPLPGLHLTCLPWQWGADVDANEALRTMMPLASPKTTTVLLAHCLVRGSSFPAHYGNGNTAKRWCLDEGFLQSSAFDFVALGDWHQRNLFLGRRGGYIGALRQLNYGEAGNPQGFIVWDSVSGNITACDINECERHVVVRMGGDGPGEPVMNDEFAKLVGSAEKARVVFSERQPTDLELAACREQGIEVVIDIAPAERVTRIEDLPEGVSGDLRKLLDLWAHNQEPPLSEEELAGLHAELETFIQQRSGASVG